MQDSLGDSVLERRLVWPLVWCTTVFSNLPPPLRPPPDPQAACKGMNQQGMECAAALPLLPGLRPQQRIGLPVVTKNVVQE